MAESARFAHLLQPIRDLSKVWKIEIADELEKYTEEVAQLVVTNPEDGISQLNFAEAALLIQGSTAIYSRKVELLYQLVYQALDLLVTDTSKDGAQAKKAKAQNGLFGNISEMEELLTIDHLLKEGRHISLDKNAPERQALQRKVPLLLMPRDQADGRTHEFRISSCMVHSTGLYLLQESDAKLLEGMSMEGVETDDPLVPAPPKEVQDLDGRLQELLKGLPATSSPSVDASPCPTELDTQTQVDDQHQVVAAPEPEILAEKEPEKAPSFSRPQGVGQDIVAATLQLPAQSDPWAFVDEHLARGCDVPLQVGKTSKRLIAKNLLTNADGLPDVSAFSAKAIEDACSASSSTNLAPLLAAGNPVESLFLAVAGQMKSGGRYETQRAAFSPAWLEFEDLFVAALGKRKQLKTSSKVRPGAGDAQVSDGSDEEAAPVTPAEGTFQDEMLTPLMGDAILSSDVSQDHQREEQRREVAMLEGMIQDAQQKYESTVRQHLQVLQKDWVAMDDPKFPQLYANVRRWQDHLEPVLKEFESRPEFDIQSYSTKFLKKMTSMDDGKTDEQGIPFARLVHGQPRWEVCRRFLTCLLLTNQGNTEIVADDERMHGFGVKLLEAEPKKISLEDEAAPLPAPVASKRKVLQGPSDRPKRRRLVSLHA